jgi:nitroreductase/NAD-dependent dihydropyrimidine dehydrogenase PreA subunit
MTKEKLIQIDQERCSQCKMCIEVCPNHILATDAQGNTGVIDERRHLCIQCAHCMAMCKEQAIRINGLSYGKDIVELPKHSLDYQGFISFLANRRSVKNYKETPVPDEVIRQVLEAVSFAPSGAEPDKMHITVINKRGTIEEALPHMEGFLDNIVRWIENPVASRLIRRRNSSETFNTLRNHVYPIAKSGNYKLVHGDRITRGAPVMFILHAEKGAEEHTDNALIYATYLILTAHSLGLGASMIGLVAPAINKTEEVRRIFRIPDDHEAVISVVIGYPKYRFRFGIRRQEHQVHWVSSP